ncbi:phage replisome organizer N-terminal domain-containing protein [Siminovitchia fortis]|uniref:Replication protein n=1 Tax=Siminovitchia fortis TaxID=254758 RepID=A0A443IMB0_9BACI|nr:phage replisome organizer N-terminal domain-containing protein [Siminovitchia fortis]RWR06718.1 replication protein [Siminovitchia fortis]WHY82982.1 phage replisome organizer N-terminal domain-containing protein [Siminovitchia fortis]
MSVKWIKLSTQMFEDEKIRLIESMPEADTILIIWVKLLAQAGKTNASGYIYLSEKIPYTDEMLATIFCRPLNIVRLALQTFEQFGMIEIEDGFINISNWEKHQNIDGMERIKKLNAERNRRYRERKKQKLLEEQKESDVAVTSRDGTDIDIDRDIDKIPYVEIINYLNGVSGKNYRPTTQKTRSVIKARWNEGFRLEDFKKVIDTKCSEWMHTDMEKFIRPETLFSNKFESYLNQKPKSENSGGRYVPENFDYDFTAGEDF